MTLVKVAKSIDPDGATSSRISFAMSVVQLFGSMPRLHRWRERARSQIGTKGAHGAASRKFMCATSSLRPHDLREARGGESSTGTGEHREQRLVNTGRIPSRGYARANVGILLNLVSSTSAENFKARVVVCYP